jgi:hypothetical protein
MKFLSNIDLAGVAKIVNIPTPSLETDLVTKSFVENAINNAIAGFDFQKDVLAVQQDNTLAPDPGTFQKGDRYIITDVATMNVAFGTVTGLENGDIIEYDGTQFVVAYDVSVNGDGILVYSEQEASYFKYVSGAWSFGGLTVINAGTGLDNTNGTFSVKVDNTTISFTAGGNLQLEDDSVGLTKLTTGLTGLGLQQSVDKKISVKLNDTRLAVDADGIKMVETYTKKVTTDIGDGSATEFNVGHNLATRDVMVQVYEKSTYATVQAEILRSTDNSVTVRFATAPSLSQYRVVVIG